MKWLTAAAVIVTAIFSSAGRTDEPSTKPRPALRATLNGSEFTLDTRTGSILRMTAPAVGTVLETTADAASLVDLAYPVEQFEPLRLASRFSSDAKITLSKGEIKIYWGRLGASRATFAPAGMVSATVVLRAAADGRSIVMTCRIENRSKRPVRQVLFPDLLGLVPTGAAKDTQFRTGACRTLSARAVLGLVPIGAVGDTQSRARPVLMKPFVDLVRSQSDQFYPLDSTFVEYSSSGKDSGMAGRWMDLSGEKGGFSLFPKRNTWDAGPTVFLQYWEAKQRLRLMCNHYVTLGEGDVWESGQYWLTPHEGPWTKGAETYQAWLREKK